MGRSDIGWANVFMIPARKKYVDFTEPFLIDRVSFMLRKCRFRIITELLKLIIFFKRKTCRHLNGCRFLHHCIIQHG